MTAPEVSHGLEVLRSMPKGSTLFTIVRSVSRSGMSQVIDVRRVQCDGPYGPDVIRVWVPELHRRLDSAGDGYICRGCGMDMAADLVMAMGYLAHDDPYWFTKREI